MRFIILRKADAATEAGQLPDPALLDQMGKFHQEMAAAGILRAGEGLKPSADGVRVQFKHGKAQVIDGPFTGFPGEVDWTAGRRVHALIAIFGRATPVELDIDQVEKTEA